MGSVTQNTDSSASNNNNNNNNPAGGNLGQLRGVVSQVLSGDTLIIQSQSRTSGQPRQEIQVTLTGINAPRLGRPPAKNSGRSDGSSDEPFAWAARERLRKLCIGQDIRFTLDPPPGGPMGKSPATAASLLGGGGDDARAQRKHATVQVRGDDGKPVNVAELLLSEGLAKLAPGLARQETFKEYARLEEEAKAQHRGIHTSDDTERQDSVRKVQYQIDMQPSDFVSHYSAKQSEHGVVKAVVEFVRDGSSVKVSTYAPDHLSFMVEMTGIRAPSLTPRDGKPPEPFSQEAYEFTRSRLLHRDVELLIEGVRPNGQTVNATLVHPVGSIEELLLKSGLARVANDSISKYTGEGGAEKLKQAEKEAKAKKAGIWKNVEPERERSSAQAKVIEVISPDAFTIKMGNGENQKIYLAGVRFRRAPRPDDAAAGGEGAEGKPAPPKRAPGGGGQKSSMYEIPYFYEAREMLRKMLIGKSVKVVEEYTQDATEKFPERKCYSLKVAGPTANSLIDPAVELAKQGYVEIIKFRQDDRKRPSNYEQLVAAEQEARDTTVGVHSQKAYEAVRINDVSMDAMKARSLSSSLKSQARQTALVEFVSSASRFKVFVPRENCLIGVVLAGVQVARVQRNTKTGEITKHDPVAEAATDYVREQIMQRDIQLQVVDMDKMGNFICWVYLPNKKLLNEELVKLGYGQLHFSAEGSTYFKALQEAEQAAKQQKIGLWKDYVEPTPEEGEAERRRRENNEDDANGDGKTATPSGGGGGINAVAGGGWGAKAAAGGGGAHAQEAKRTRVLVTEINTEGLKFYAQNVSDGEKLVQLMSRLRAEIQQNPPTPGAFTPRVKAKCAAQFSYDKQWYRAIVEKIEKDATSGEKKMLIRYIDYGNAEWMTASKLANLPSGFDSLPPQAHEFQLALVRDASAENADETVVSFQKLALNREMMLEQVRLNGATYARLFPVKQQQQQQQQAQPDQQQPSTSSAAASSSSSSAAANTNNDEGAGPSLSEASGMRDNKASNQQQQQQQRQQPQQQQQQPQSGSKSAEQQQGDVGLQLIRDGIVLMDEKPNGRFIGRGGGAGGRPLPEFVEQYRKAQDEAKHAHIGIWRYGDPTPDDF